MSQEIILPPNWLPSLVLLGCAAGAVLWFVRSEIARQRRTQLLTGAAMGFACGTGLLALVDTIFSSSAAASPAAPPNPLSQLFGGHVSDEEVYFLRSMLHEMRRRRAEQVPSPPGHHK